MYIDEYRNRRVDRRNGFNCQHGVEEASARAAQRLGNLDPHQPERKEFVHEAGANCCSSSIVRTTGAIVSRANCFTVA